MKPFDLTGRVAIVTGGNGGIGLGMARGMADAGATILIAGRDREKSAGAVRENEAAGGKADAVEVDVLQPEACRAMIATATERFGRLEILVNNAGTNIRKPPQAYTLEDRQTVLPTTLARAFRHAQAAYPAMVGGVERARGGEGKER